MVTKRKRVTAIKVLRMQRGVTQIALAAETGIRLTRLSHLECGWYEPKATELQKLANALDVPVEQLLDVAA